MGLPQLVQFYLRLGLWPKLPRTPGPLVPQQPSHARIPAEVLFPPLLSLFCRAASGPLSVMRQGTPLSDPSRGSVLFTAPSLPLAPSPSSTTLQQHSRCLQTQPLHMHCSLRRLEHYLTSPSIKHLLSSFPSVSSPPRLPAPLAKS